MTVDADQIHEDVAWRLLVDPNRESIDNSTEESLHFGVDRLQQPRPCQSKHPFDLRAT